MFLFFVANTSGSEFFGRLPDGCALQGGEHEVVSILNVLAINEGGEKTWKGDYTESGEAKQFLRELRHPAARIAKASVATALVSCENGQIAGLVPSEQLGPRLDYFTCAERFLYESSWHQFKFTSVT